MSPPPPPLERKLHPPLRFLTLSTCGMHLSLLIDWHLNRERGEEGPSFKTSIHFILFFQQVYYDPTAYSVLCERDMISIINNLLTISQAGKPSRISISRVAPPCEILSLGHYVCTSFIERRGQNKRTNNNQNDRKSK